MAIRWELDKAKHADTYRQVMLKSAKPNPIARVTISIIRWSALGGRCFSLFLASFSSSVYTVSTGYTKLKRGENYGDNRKEASQSGELNCCNAV